MAVQAWCGMGRGTVAVGKKCIGRTAVETGGAATAVYVVDMNRRQFNIYWSLWRILRHI